MLKCQTAKARKKPNEVKMLKDLWRVSKPARIFLDPSPNILCTKAAQGKLEHAWDVGIECGTRCGTLLPETSRKWNWNRSNIHRCMRLPIHDCKYLATISASFSAFNYIHINWVDSILWMCCINLCVVAFLGTSSTRKTARAVWACHFSWKKLSPRGLASDYCVSDMRRTDGILSNS